MRSYTFRRPFSPAGKFMQSSNLEPLVQVAAARERFLSVFARVVNDFYILIPDRGKVS
jgi:hypothetical protein